MKRVTRPHILYCMSNTCFLKSHLIMPEMPAYQMDDGRLLCEACAAAEGPLPA